MTAVVAFSLAAVVTYLLRSGMTLTPAGWAANRQESWGALVSPAVLTAMVLTALVLDHGDVVRPALAEMLAIIAAIDGDRRSGNMSVALVARHPAVWLVGVFG